MNILKRSLAMFLVLCMLISVVPLTAFSAEIDSTIPTVTEPTEESATATEGTPDVTDETTETTKETMEATEETTETTKETMEATEDTTEATEDTTEATEDPYSIELTDLEPTDVSLTHADEYRILHLDCGRKYFRKNWIIALINEMEAAGYTHLELAFGNDGLRFLLDDMSVDSYSDAQVTAAIQQGNKYYHDFGTNELTESEMNAIIEHAKSKGIEIIPLLNNPGHMNAIVSAASSLTGSSAGYNGSSSTVDLENEAAVAFTKGLLEKYIAYFGGKGCNEFNFGADEYANDVHSTGSMGFGNLVNDGKYSLFVNYVNGVADLIKGYGMVPVAFNDGIYFNQNTSCNFDKQIMVAFWTSGWPGYQSASANTMASLGHEMINVNGDYYYVLGKSDQWDSNGYTYASNWSNTAFMGSTVSNPAGSMFCIWCDYPGAETETQIAANTRMILRAMAAEMQGKDATTVNTDVVPGGFNADGTIAEDCNNVTVKDETTTVEVTACDLTSVTVTEVTAPEIADAAYVRAWDITPYVGAEKHTGKGTVKLPVPSGWNTALLKGFYVENGEAVLVEGEYADGFYTFTMPHFSVGGVMQLDANAPDEIIELNVGATYTEQIAGVELNDQTFTPAPDGIATVTTEVYTVEGNKELVRVESTSDIVSGGKYLITTPQGAILTDNKGSYYFYNNLLALEKSDVDVNNSNVWTITSSGSGYTISSGDNSYLTFAQYTASVTSTATYIAIDEENSGFTLRINGVYLNNFGGAGKAAGGGNKTNYNSNSRWYLYRIVGADTTGGTNVTFTGDAPGEATVTINNTVYKIIVHGTMDITIKYVDENGTFVKTETVTVADNATTHTLSNFNHNGKYYTVANTTLSIDPANTTEYTVAVTEVEEDLSQVNALKIEYWQTNATVLETFGGSVRSKSVTAEAAYSENGVDLSTIIPVKGYKSDAGVSDPALVYWRSRLLPLPENEQTGANGDDETLSGTGFTKVRYWNGTWAVYTDANVWQDIDLRDYQLVAYYMNDMHLADEVSVSTSDWGKKGNGEFANSYLGQSNVSLAFQIVYEDGTTAPVDETATSLAPYTYFVDHWGNRGVGTIGINQIGDYQIWKITAETGAHNVSYTGQYNPIRVTDFKWDNNEMTVWEGKPVSQYTILNPAQDPMTDGYYDNLRWNEPNESILIRIYVKAVETEDSLTVVYYDEKFGDTLYTYSISVDTNKNFKNDIVGSTVFADNANRIDVSNAYIVNALDKKQYFQTDLTKVPEAKGKYNSELYTYTGSEISEDGKKLYLYYNIDTSVLKPNFVVDFGLPITFNLSDVTNTPDSVKTVTASAKYGTVSYDPSEKTFTYTPSGILPNIDVLSINILFDGETSATTTNVGVTPATTVFYEESFITWDSDWTVNNDSVSVGNQTTEVLGEKKNNFGYDPCYANTTGASNGTDATTTVIGAKGTFKFTGNGIQIFANATEGSGYVSVEVKNSSGAIVNLSMVDTVVSEGTTGATSGQIGEFYGLPIVSLIDLQNMPHGTYTVTITKIMDNEPVSIDGIRVFNTIKDSSIFTEDQEDNPNFYELRDSVLYAIGVDKDTSEDYKTMYEQVYDAVKGATTLITDASVTYDNSSTVQDLLDNGPKNEIYLYADQTLTFKVSTNRVMQIGMKAPQGATTASISISVDGGTATTTSQNVGSSVDMFYPLADNAESTTEYFVQIKNTGSSILSITELKICDDPNAAFVPFTVEEIEAMLCGDSVGETPAEPEVPVEPETPVEPEKPEAVYADAVLTVHVVDYTGAVLGAVDLSLNGVEGETAVFTASEILAAAQAQMPEKYALVDENAAADVSVAFGAAETTDIQIGKAAALNITFVNLLGKKQGSATITAVQTADGYCRISASEIKAAAPAGRRVMWFIPAYVPYGGTVSIVVPVI